MAVSLGLRAVSHLRRMLTRGRGSVLEGDLVVLRRTLAESMMIGSLG